MRWPLENVGLLVAWAQVVEEMVRQAGPGGEFEHALVLVSGDHGE
jgi:hypothetical protein